MSGTSDFSPRRPRPSERARQPRPLLRRRVSSGRGATEQPNVTGDDDTPLTIGFWLLVVATGVCAGVSGVLLMMLLFTVSDLAFGPGAGGGNFQDAVTAAGPLERVLPLLIAGVVGGCGWFLLRRFVPGRSDVDDTIWTGDGTLNFRRSAGTCVLSEIVVGLGASLGREAAPKLMGGVCGSVLARWSGLSAPQRRLLVACGAGAGLACVYNVPLGGALFTAEVLLGTVRLPVMLPALACSSTATLVAWLYLPQTAIYPHVPAYAFHSVELVWAVLAGPLIGAAAAGLIRLIGWVSFHQPKKWWMALPAPLAAFSVLAALGRSRTRSVTAGRARRSANHNRRNHRSCCRPLLRGFASAVRRMDQVLVTVIPLLAGSFGAAASITGVVSCSCRGTVVGVKLVACRLHGVGGVSSFPGSSLD